jgi:hypothetical protein
MVAMAKVIHRYTFPVRVQNDTQENTGAYVLEVEQELSAAELEGYRVKTEGSLNEVLALFDQLESFVVGQPVYKKVGR